MTIEEAQDKQNQLTYDVGMLCKKFEEETKLKVTEIRIVREETVMGDDFVSLSAIVEL